MPKCARFEEGKEKCKNLLTNSQKCAIIVAMLKKGGFELDMDGDSSGEANCIPLNQILLC